MSANDPMRTCNGVNISISLSIGRLPYAEPKQIHYRSHPLRGDSMRRREFIAGLGAATALPLATRAQQPAKKPRVGMLWHAGNAEEEAIFLAAFRQGLADAGYIEGHNIVVEHRFPNEIPERFHTMAEELARLNPDVLAAAGQPPSLALQQATSTIPIVFIS